jgi:hypothetical protein
MFIFMLLFYFVFLYGSVHAYIQKLRPDANSYLEKSVVHPNMQPRKETRKAVTSFSRTICEDKVNPMLKVSP